MPKRKREETRTDGIDGAVASSVSGQSKRVAEKLHHSEKIVHRALKLARGFERQKLGRRHKTAVQSGSQAVDRINGEITALKVLQRPSSECYMGKADLKPFADVARCWGCIGT